jgi:hypothetical protein
VVWTRLADQAEKNSHIDLVYETPNRPERATVCRQSISDSWLGNLRECLVESGAGSEKRRIDAARRWSGAAAESNGSDCWAMVHHPNHARLAQLDGNTVAFGPVSPTQDGLSAVVCAPGTMGSRGTTAANGPRLVPGVVSATDASFARVTAAVSITAGHRCLHGSALARVHYTRLNRRDG